MFEVPYWAITREKLSDIFIQFQGEVLFQGLMNETNNWTMRLFSCQTSHGQCYNEALFVLCQIKTTVVLICWCWSFYLVFNSSVWWKWWKGHIIRDVTWGHWVFRVCQHHSPSPRRSHQGWPSPGSCPKNTYTPRLAPPYGFCFHTHYHAQETEHCSEGRGCEGTALPPDSTGESTQRHPSTRPYFILGPLSLIGFPHPVFPGNSELLHDHLLLGSILFESQSEILLHP